MIRDEVRRLWAEPRPPGPPRLGRWDWALLAAGLGATTLEGTLRPDVAWRPLAVLVSVGLVLATLWRRTHPLAMVAAAFGSGIVLTLVELGTGRPEPIGLYSGLVILVLVYALPRWGSGREIVLGSAIALAACALSLLTEELSPGEQLGGLLFLAFPGVLGACVRIWSTSRRRRLERMRSLEREQLARELHDTVAHRVSAIVIRAQAGQVLAGAGSPGAVAALAGIEEEGSRTLEAMRTMVVALRGGAARAELAPLGGLADLQRLAAGPSGLPVTLRLDGRLDDLPPAVDAAVHRIAQESVANAARHAAAATGVEIRVTGEPDRVLVTIRDDGTGAGRGAGPEGRGLTGLRERAALLGGVLRAGPGADQGWLVEAELPRGG